MLKKIGLFVCIFANLLLLFIPGITTGDDGLNNPTSVYVSKTDVDKGLFEVRIVSPEMLESVIINGDSSIIPLKVERGLYIGAISQGILYLRGDLSKDEFPVLDNDNQNTEKMTAQHLIDITFGLDNAETDLFDDSYDYMVWIDSMYTKLDLQAIQEYISIINELSQTITFEDDEIALPSYQPNYQPIQYLYYKISFVDRDLFDELLDNRDSAIEQLMKDKNGNIVGIVRKNHLTLLSDLSGDERKHFLMRGLLFSMGFHGESMDLDSFFNPDNVTSTHLSPLDKEAIKLMYGGRLPAGLDINGIKKSLGIDINDE